MALDTLNVVPGTTTAEDVPPSQRPVPPAWHESNGLAALVVPVGTLLKAIGDVTACVSRRSYLPVLSCLSLSVTDGRGTLTATDLEVVLSVHLDGWISEGVARAVVPARELLDYLRALPKRERATIEVDGEYLRVTCGRLARSFRSMEPAEYPALPTLSAAVEAVSFARIGDATTLAAQLEAVALAASKDTTRRVFTGINWAVQPDGTIELAAADSFRLAIATLSGATVTHPDAALCPSFITPAANIVRIAKRLSRGPVSIITDPQRNMVHIVQEDRTAALNLLADTYPNYHAIVPKSRAVTLTVDAGELTRTIKALGILENNILRVRFTQDTLEVSGPGVNGEVGPIAAECGVSWTPGADQCGFTLIVNARYLLDALSVVKGDARINLNAPTFPYTVAPATETPGAPFFVAMPMHNTR